MKPLYPIAAALSVVLAIASPVAAQRTSNDPTPPAPAPTAGGAAGTPAAAKDETKTETESILESWKKGRPVTIQYLRALDQRGINVFETTKTPGVEYTGFKLDFGAAFTSQVQNLSHSNMATPVLVNNVNTNQLADIGFGFNNSTANLSLNAQLAPGIRVALTSYLSSRHHNETWVKDGYIQIDESPIDFVPLKALMQIVTVRVGHMEINYGDAHFRRSDNGNAIYNPFVGNYIMDAFTTEVGGEVYASVSQGRCTKPTRRSAARSTAATALARATTGCSRTRRRPRPRRRSPAASTRASRTRCRRFR
jgi:hypothetical protein